MSRIETAEPYAFLWALPELVISRCTLSFPMPFTIEKLRLYQRAVDFADYVLATTEKFPRGYGFLSNQLNRAAVSIAANIAEGNGRHTNRDRAHFFRIARGSTLECLPLLELSKRRALIDEKLHGRLVDLLESISKMIAGMIHAQEQRKRPSA